MIKILLTRFITVVLLLTVNNIFCQSTKKGKYYNENDLSIYFGILHYTSLYFNGGEYSLKNETVATEFTTINGIQIKNNQFGIGLGVDKWQHALLIPIFFHYQLSFTQKTTSPYLFFDLGHALGKKNKTQFDEKEKGSILLKIGMGIHFKLTDKFIIKTGLTYKLQTMRSSYQKVIDPRVHQNSSNYTIYYKFTGIHVGMKF